jgi:glycosyltransferase involved in cell wall biosynthesis
VRVAFLLEDYHGYYTRRLTEQPAERAYAETLSRLMAECFYVADSYAWAMESLGHETATYIPGCAPLQRLWAREHGLPGDEASALWRDRVLDAQMADFGPEVVFVFSGVPLSPARMRSLRRRSRLLVLQWSAVLATDVPYDGFDLVLTTLPRLAEHFRGRGIGAEVITHTFDPRILDRVPTRARRGAVFIGTLQDQRDRRIGIVERLAAEVDDFTVYAPNLDRVSAESPVRARFAGEAFALPMYEAYAGALAAVHVPGDDVLEYAGARRPVEVAGMGCALVTLDQPGLDSLFEPDVEAVRFKDAADCVRQVRRLLADPELARRIGRAGQERVLRDHAVTALAPRLEQYFREYTRPRRTTWPLSLLHRGR